MKLIYRMEGRGLHGAYRLPEDGGPMETVAFFSSEMSARRFVLAGNKALSKEQEAEARRKNGFPADAV